MISAHKTKNGFPKGSFCAVRIEAYNEVLDLLDTLEEPVSEDQPLLNLEIPAGDVAPAEEEGGPWEEDEQ